MEQTEYSSFHLLRRRDTTSLHCQEFRDVPSDENKLFLHRKTAHINVGTGLSNISQGKLYKPWLELSIILSEQQEMLRFPKQFKVIDNTGPYIATEIKEAKLVH